MARRGMRTYPSHGPKDGRGARIDDASGFLRRADDFVRDVRQGLASRDHADITPGFGTRHPQDVKHIEAKQDPKPIEQARTEGNPAYLSPRDLGYTDAEVRAMIQAGKPLIPKG